MYRIVIPQFTKKFSASNIRNACMLCFWCLLLTVFILNIYLRISLRSPLTDRIENTLASLYDPQTHITLAQYYWQHGQKALARNEVKALEYIRIGENRNKNVLGASTIAQQYLSLWDQEELSLKTDYAYWRTVVEQKPNYQDAYIQAAVLAFRLGLINDAKTYFEQAYTINPNNELVQKSLLYLDTFPR